jgi:DNA repair protein RadC
MNPTHIPMNQLPSEEQPDYKFKRYGPDALSDAELFAILLRCGGKGQSALDLSHQLLNHVQNNLHRLSKLQPTELRQIKGIGNARALVISAAMELARRKQASPPINNKQITSSRDVGDYLKNKLGELGHEIFGVVYLNRANRVIEHEIVSKGGITGTVADIRIILKNALIHGATSILIFHNHPSGNLQPSQADITLTIKFKKAAETMDIKLLDHLIISHEGYLSLLDEGFLG